MGRGWPGSSSSGFSWPEFDFPISSRTFRWPEINFSYITSWWGPHSSSFSWSWWPDLDFSFSIVDSVMWSFITAIESLALVAMLCFFFLCCGCTV
ncbi:hypothetical protein AQUCO_00300475v1 [Aquilegia coerulea]|uniref:Uncharacterized protein n=1 Tax=Aquilegia coerulea TaxID=218851 RepID=A0A2G5EYZ8_AQUCA|nr:hypothetical protein AQUCO_00300475v1 [Aquilegia coerulea]